MSLAAELSALRPMIGASPLDGFEYVKGFGVFSLPFDSGHVLALRVFPENDFGAYVTIWHRTPAGEWSIFVDGPSAGIACPRYFGAATKHVGMAKIVLEWTGPSTLSIRMDTPSLEWTVEMHAPPLFRLMNALSTLIPFRLSHTPAMLRLFEWLAWRVFGFGRVTMSGLAPNGQQVIMAPKKMFPIAASRAVLDGVDLGRPRAGGENPSIGELRLPSRGVFSVGQGYFRKALDRHEPEPEPLGS